VAHNIGEIIASISEFGLTQLNRADTLVTILSIPVKLNFSRGIKVAETRGIWIILINGKAILERREEWMTGGDGQKG